MFSKTDIINILTKNKQTITEFGVVKLGLFGSYHRNEQSESSDIDFLVLFEKEKKTYRNFFNLGLFLETLLNKKVELVTPESLEQFMKSKILKDVEDVLFT